MFIEHFPQHYLLYLQLTIQSLLWKSF